MGDIISGNFDPSLVKNKIVLIGMTATGEQDIWPIPNSAGEVPGVEIHAAAMDTILRQNYITPVDMITMVWIMLILTSILAFILPRWRTWHWTDIAKATGITGGLLIIYIIASSIAAGKGHILNVLYPVLLLMVIYVANILFMLITEQSEKRFVSTFSAAMFRRKYLKKLLVWLMPVNSIWVEKKGKSRSSLPISATIPKSANISLPRQLSKC